MQILLHLILLLGFVIGTDVKYKDDFVLWESIVDDYGKKDETKSINCGAKKCCIPTSKGFCLNFVYSTNSFRTLEKEYQNLIKVKEMGMNVPLLDKVQNYPISVEFDEIQQLKDLGIEQISDKFFVLREGYSPPHVFVHIEQYAGKYYLDMLPTNYVNGEVIHNNVLKNVPAHYQFLRSVFFRKLQIYDFRNSRWNTDKFYALNQSLSTLIDFFNDNTITDYQFFLNEDADVILFDIENLETKSDPYAKKNVEELKDYFNLLFNKMPMPVDCLEKYVEWLNLSRDYPFQINTRKSGFVYDATYFDEELESFYYEKEDEFLQNKIKEIRPGKGDWQYFIIEVKSNGKEMTDNEESNTFFATFL